MGMFVRKVKHPMRQKHVVCWKRLDTLGLEYAEVRSAPVRLDGDLLYVDEEGPCAVSYHVDCDRMGLTTLATVRLRRGGLASARTLVRREDSTWTLDEHVLPCLAGLSDVDLSVTPSTNTLPIRRLKLAIGQRANVTAAWVKFPSLDVASLRQTYRRVAGHIYEYEAPDLDFRAELSVDDQGIVETYGGLWARLPVQM